MIVISKYLILSKWEISEARSKLRLGHCNFGINSLRSVRRCN